MKEIEENYDFICLKCNEKLLFKNLLSYTCRIQDDYGTYIDEIDILEVLTDCRFHIQNFKK